MRVARPDLGSTTSAALQRGPEGVLVQQAAVLKPLLCRTCFPSLLELYFQFSHLLRDVLVQSAGTCSHVAASGHTNVVIDVPR